MILMRVLPPNVECVSCGAHLIILSMDEATQVKAAWRTKFWTKYQNVYQDSGIPVDSRDKFCVKCYEGIETSKVKVSNQSLFEKDKRFKPKDGSHSNEASDGKDKDNPSGRSDPEESDLISVPSDGVVVVNCGSSKVTEVTIKRKTPEMSGVANPADNKKRRCTRQSSSVKNGVRQEEEEEVVDPKGSEDASGKSSSYKDDDSNKVPNMASDPAQSSAVKNSTTATPKVASPVAPIDPIPTPEASGNHLNEEAMSVPEDCSVVRALKKMYYGGGLLDECLTVFNKQPVQLVSIQFNSSIFRLWRILCPEDTFRRPKKPSRSKCQLHIDNAGIKAVTGIVTYMHTGLPLKPAQLLDFLSSSPITLTDPFIVGLIILQSVFGMGEEDLKTLQSQLRSKESSHEIGLLTQCLELGSERKAMIMTMFSSMRKLSSSTETTFYLWLRQTEKVVYTMEERHMVFHWLYFMYANSPETAPIRILLANLSPDSPEESDLVFSCKEPGKQVYSFKCHSIMLMLHQGQQPGKVDFDAVVNNIQENLRNQLYYKTTITSFMKIMYKVGGNKPGKIDMSVRNLVRLSKVFCIFNPMELAFGRLLPDSGVNLRMFLDFFDATAEPKYLNNIFTNPLMYLTSTNVASLKTKQMECILKSDDLKMPETDVYKLFICFAKSAPSPDEYDGFKEVPQRMKCLVKFVRFGLLEKEDFEEVEKEKLIPVEIRMPFSYRLKCPDEEINVPAYMHKPFVKRNL